ncbi:DoxX family protein [Nocardioides iriomotensis]|uniref:DoxX family protein n=1 Tax=Nocardioides iriomotensis TaxID=715784 RepID=UPI001F0FEB6D|nr:DoxX family protein [Nocardioides iriomotensis]
MTTIPTTRPALHRTTTTVEDAVRRAQVLLDRHSITLLRWSLGFVFLLFGALKFVPGLSPAADLATRTVEALTFGLVTGPSALLMTATLETFIGITLLSGRFLKAGLAVLGMSLVGIMSPLVLFPGELFPAGPTSVGQYVIKDVVLVAGGLVVAAHALGARLTRREDVRH